MGIGLHGGGVGVIKFLAAQGAKILATDLRKKEELQSSLDALKDWKDIEYVLGEHRLKDFKDTDLVIKNPGVPENSKYLTAAKEKNISIESDIGIFLELCPAPIIGVTGTKGKSTTAALLTHILGRHYPKVILAGNIRQSVLEKLSEINKDTLVVLELSSWQLADARSHKKSPYVAVMTNIMPDHQNRYANFDDYVADKKLIFKFQKEKDYLFLNFSDPLLRDCAKETTSRIYFYSLDGDALLKEELPKLNQKARLGAYLRGQKIYYGASQNEICEIGDIRLIGQHNLTNVLAAISVADLYNVPPEKTKLALRDFQGLDGRFQLIDKIKGITFINDTTATTPDATIAGLKALTVEDKKIILISGGADKELNFDAFGEIVGQKCKLAILLPGTATEKIKTAIRDKTSIKNAYQMKEAVKLAVQAAAKNDFILLSPGCASFGLFRHEFERGEAFNQAVAALKAKPKK